MYTHLQTPLYAEHNPIKRQTVNPLLQQDINVIDYINNYDMQKAQLDISDVTATLLPNDPTDSNVGDIQHLSDSDVPLENLPPGQLDDSNITARPIEQMFIQPMVVQEEDLLDKRKRQALQQVNQGFLLLLHDIFDSVERIVTGSSQQEEQVDRMELVTTCDLDPQVKAISEESLTPLLTVQAFLQ